MIKIKIITANTIPTKALNKEILKLAKNLGEFIAKEFAKSYRTWTKQPEFKTVLKSNSRQISVKVFTTNKIYGYINSGTRVRRVLLKRPFKRKTKAGRLKAKSGTNSGVIVSRKFNFPGIPARKFDELVVKSSTKQLKKQTRKFSSRLAKKFK